MASTRAHWGHGLPWTLNSDLSLKITFCKCKELFWNCVQMKLFVWKSLIYRWTDQLLEVFAKLWKMGFVHSDVDWGFHQTLLPSKSLSNVAILIVHIQWIGVQCLTSGPKRDHNTEIKENGWLTKIMTFAYFSIGTGLQQKASNSVQEILIPSMNQRQTRNKTVDNSGIHILNTKSLGFHNGCFAVA